MAKRQKIQLNWNGLTVEDIDETIAHFAQMERQYQQELHDHQIMPTTTLRVLFLEKSIRITQSRQSFWNEMKTRKANGEKIRSHVREYASYCKTNGELQ